PFRYPYTPIVDVPVSLAPATDSIQLRATAAGSGALRIVSTDDELYGEVPIVASSIDHIELCISRVCDTHVTLAGETIGVALFDPDDHRLVDDGLTVDPGGLPATHTWWDRLDVSGAPASGDYSIIVTAGDHAPVTLTLTVD